MKFFRLVPVWATLFSSLILILLFVAWPESVQAGCQINVYVKNTGRASLRVGNDTNFTGVKSKGGVWRSLEKGKWFWQVEDFVVTPGVKKGDSYSATFRCAAKRRYRISYMCESGRDKGRYFSTYYPSSTGWTTNQTLTISLPQCK